MIVGMTIYETVGINLDLNSPDHFNHYIDSIWDKIKKDFYLDAQIVRSTQYLDSLGGAKGAFFAHANIVILREEPAFSTAMVLLHETCHAIQHKENRITSNPNHTRKIYGEEIEAELFAFSNFDKYFGKELGANRTSWTLAHYDTYRMRRSTKNKMPTDNAPMNPEELSDFIVKLDNPQRGRLLDLMSQFES